MSDQLFLFSKLFKLIKKHVVSWFQQHLDGTPKLSVVSNRDTANHLLKWISNDFVRGTTLLWMSQTSFKTETNLGYLP